ncbi:hypothetical protein HK104_003046, partial [Borealophlyctis nickersoniae]
MAPIASQIYADTPQTTVPTVTRLPSHTPVPGLPPVNTLGPESIDGDSTTTHSHRRHKHKHVVLVEPKVGSLENVSYHPGGGDVEIFEEKLEFEKKARSRVGSLE